MLLIRQADSAADWHEVAPGAVHCGLHEDTNYILALPDERGQRVFMDDVELLRTGQHQFPWRPALYAGRVSVQVLETSESLQSYWLDVSPSPVKSGDAHFAEMIESIRSFDARLLTGDSAATNAFGREHQEDAEDYSLAGDIALSRLRLYGPAFLEAVERIARLPHRSLTSQLTVLPLSRIKHLHPLALRDRRLADIARGTAHVEGDLQSIQLHSATSTMTFDTPANRAVLALLKRFRARVQHVRQLVELKQLGTDAELQAPRAERRLGVLDNLEGRTTRLIRSAPFSEVTKVETTAASLTQIASQPNYSKAHRNGINALATGVAGSSLSDELHVPPSWGIYELWCYLDVVALLGQVLAQDLVRVAPRAASAKLGYGTRLPDGSTLEVLFQAKFSAGQPAGRTRSAWSISGEREPDILVVHHGTRTSAMVLDAKWRAGRANVLDAMVSAHIYHDALRVDETTRPAPCLLLLPGLASVESLEGADFIRRHEVGALGQFCIDGIGRTSLREHLYAWLAVRGLALVTRPQNA